MVTRVRWMAALATVMLCVVLVTLGGLWPAIFVEPALKAVQGF